MDVCSAPTGVERRNEVCEAGSPLALDNGQFTRSINDREYQAQLLKEYRL
ncbi:MAG: hypothetical protein U0L06_00100 [Agathobacter sp.]|nr:hypothetical protein [Agathobacter sp.]